MPVSFRVNLPWWRPNLFLCAPNQQFLAIHSLLVLNEEVSVWRSCLIPYSCLDIDADPQESCYRSETKDSLKRASIQFFSWTRPHSGPSSVPLRSSGSDTTMENNEVWKNTSYLWPRKEKRGCVWENQYCSSTRLDTCTFLYSLQLQFSNHCSYGM